MDAVRTQWEHSRNVVQTLLSIPGLYYVNEDHIGFVLRWYYVNAVVSTTLLSPYCVLVRSRPHYDFFEHVQNLPTSTKTIKIAPRPYRFLLRSFYRVRTEIGNQNSRTFPGLFKDYLHFSRSHFIWTVTHLTLLIRRISVPFKIINAFPFRAHCFCLISALCIVSARYFRFCLSRFPLCKVSLPVAFDSYYLNQIE